MRIVKDDYEQTPEFIAERDALKIRRKRSRAIRKAARESARARMCELMVVLGRGYRRPDPLPVHMIERPTEEEQREYW